MNKRNVFFVLAALVFLPGTLFAQSYITSAGLRLAKGNNRMVGLTLQQRMLKNVTFEGIIQTDFRDNHTVSLLLEKHQPLIGKRLNFYYGAGLGLGNEESFYRVEETNEKVFTYGNKTIGVDAIAGVEFTMLKLNVSLDMKPNFNLVGRENFMSWQTGISIRSVIVTQADKRKRDRKKRREERRKDGGLFGLRK